MAKNKKALHKLIHTGAMGEHVQRAFVQCMPSAMPEHANAVSILKTMLHDAAAPNVLLYGKEGLPHSMLLNAAFAKDDVARAEKQWRNGMVYGEYGMCFVVDLQDPNQPRNLVNALASFVAEVCSHTCMYAPRHVIILQNIDFARATSQLMRVMFERHSRTTWFVCSTYRIDSVELPIRSRFLLLRIPLLTKTQLRTVMSAAHLVVPDAAWSGGGKYCNLSRGMLLAELARLNKDLPCPLEHLSGFEVPFIVDAGPGSSLQQIRVWAQNIVTFQTPINDVVTMLLRILPEESKHAFVEQAACLDHACAVTDRHRKILYVERIIHAALQP